MSEYELSDTEKLCGHIIIWCIIIIWLLPVWLILIDCISKLPNDLKKWWKDLDKDSAPAPWSFKRKGYGY